MKHLTKLVLALLMGFASSVALADNGAFASVDVGPAAYGYGYSTPIGIRIGGGYNFIELLDKDLSIGAEAAYVNFGSASWFANSLKTQGVTLNALATYKIPHVPNLAAFAKVGMIYASTVYNNGLSYTSTTTSVPVVGVGVQYSFNKLVSAHVQYVDYGSAVQTPFWNTNVTMFSGGATFSF